MDWIDRALLTACTAAVVLTLARLARTIRDVMSSQEGRRAPDHPDVGPDDRDRGIPIWADDVLAEDEKNARATEGAAAHSSDVCTWWDEEDARQARHEAAARIQRSLRGPP